MSFVKVYIHFVWSTKNREPFLDSLKIRQKVWQHIKENAKEKGINIDFVNGFSDHCHCLISLDVNQNIHSIVKMIKGESSFWINNSCLLKDLPNYSGNIHAPKFEWQKEYFAISVSESLIQAVRNYIKNQEEHHSKTSFENEYEKIIKNICFDKLED
jgi:putative transposase